MRSPLLLRRLFYLGDMASCKNCDYKFDGNYCPNCGQKDNSGRIILRESLAEVFSAHFDLDAPLFRTIRDMFYRPGAMIRNYIFGKRKYYMNPVRYFLLMLGLYLIVDGITGFDPIVTFGEILDVKEQPNPNSISTRSSGFFRDHINSFLFVFVFTLAICSKLFNVRSIYTLPEYLVLAFFTTGQYLFVSIFVILLSFVNPAFFLINYGFVLLFPVFVLVQFHEKKPILNTIKNLIAVLFGWLLYAMLGFVISMFIIQNFYS